MTEEAYPWRDGRTLEMVIEASRPWLEKRRKIKPGSGYSEPEIQAMEKRMGRPLPADLRTFYGRVIPLELFTDGGPGEFAFSLLDELAQGWVTVQDAEPVEDWSRAEVLPFGGNDYGDVIVWIRGHRQHPDGCIALFDHERHLGDLLLPILARSLSEFISKVVYCNGLDPGGSEDEDLDDPDIDLTNYDGQIAAYELFQREYTELNPTVKKSKSSE